MTYSVVGIVVAIVEETQNSTRLGSALGKLLIVVESRARLSSVRLPTLTYSWQCNPFPPTW